MREIADRAGVNPALLHYYFGTKTGLFTAIVERVYEQLHTELDPLESDSGPAKDQLTRLLAAYTRVIASEPYIARLMIEEMLERGDRSQQFTHRISDLLSLHLSRILDRGMATGEFRRVDLPFPFREIAPQVVFFLLMAPLTHREQDALTRLNDWAEEVARLLLYGLTRSTSDA